MSKTLVGTLVGLCVAAATSAAAQPSSTAEIAAIRSEMAVLMQRLERLEQAAQTGAPGAAASPPPGGSSPAAAPATERLAASPPEIRFNGDLRYRHESINEDQVDERHRQRIRARFGVAADIGEDLRVGLTLSTGEDDPVSGNQTLDGGFDRKTFGVDRAFFTWQATEQLSFTGGKMANPFFRPGGHHLIYDGDLNPEGLALGFSRGNWFASYAGLWVEERSSANDSILLGGQVGYRRTLVSGMRLTAGASYYDYLETEGQVPFYDGAANGNRVDAAGNYLSDFNEAELFAELRWQPGMRPVTLFADYVTNTEAVGADRGLALGGALGEVSRGGTWRLGYAYQDLEADAVIATFTDSDFAGGGTDGKGHVVEFNYALRDRWLLGFRYFINERGANLGNEHDFNRLQADVSFTY